MPKNKVQFQKGQSLPEFLELYGTVAQCEQAVFAARWPKGFLCPNCGYRKSCQLRQRKVFQCVRCKHQASLTAGTLFDNTKLPLTTWFLAIEFGILRGRVRAAPAHRDPVVGLRTQPGDGLGGGQPGVHDHRRARPVAEQLAQAGEQAHARLGCSQVRSCTAPGRALAEAARCGEREAGNAGRVQRLGAQGQACGGPGPDNTRGGVFADGGRDSPL